MNTVFEYILKAVFSVVGAGLGTLIAWSFKTYVFPWLKVKLGNARYEALRARIKDLMAAAEEKFGSGEGAEKSAWVVNMVLGLFPNQPDVTKEYIEIIIKSLMQELTNEGVINTQRFKA